MKHAWYILSFFSVLASCDHSDKELKERIIYSDSVAINYFKGDGTMDTVVAVRIIRDRQKIEKLADLISDHTVEKDILKCGYDGSLHFFKMNKVIQDIDFRMNAGDCMSFSFLQNGKPHVTALSEEAKVLITSFRK